MSARIIAEAGGLAFYSPYDPDLVVSLKATIPGGDRAWDKARRCWMVAPAHLPALESLCRQFGISVTLPAGPVYDAPQVVQRIKRIEYIGAPKEREDGSFTAYGYTDGGWNVIFPQGILRGWFGVSDAAPTAAVTLYGVLGVAKSAAGADVKTAYRKLAKRWHPDVNRDPDAGEMFKRINAAYETLSDPARRRKYDAGLALEATLGKSARPAPADQWRPPLRCGLLLLEGIDRFGRLNVQKIHAWQDIVDWAGRVLVTSWPAGAEHFMEMWV